MDEKINNLKNKIELNKNKNEEGNQEKFINLEKDIKNLKNKINKYELGQLIENIAILIMKENDTKI